MMKTSGVMFAKRVQRKQSKIKDKCPTGDVPPNWISTPSSDATGKRQPSESHERLMADLSPRKSSPIARASQPPECRLPGTYQRSARCTARVRHTLRASMINVNDLSNVGLIASLVLFDLEAQESVDCFKGFFVRGGNKNTSPAGRFLVRVMNISLQPLHLWHSRRNSIVNEHRNVEISILKCLCDVF